MKILQNKTETGGIVSPMNFIHDLTPDDLPAEVRHMARRCLVDTLAIWAAGHATQPSRIVRDHAAKRYAGTLPLPFDGRKVNSVGFAFAGAATIDAIDGHDGHQLCKGHASVALVPALFGELGSAPDCTLEELLTHLIVGEEIAIRAGLSLHATVPDYHSSGAWNALGCAAIAARLRKLSVEQTRHALGIAEYYGPRAQMMRCIAFPTMVKDSSSWGALTGISATDLAEDGFTGAPAITCEADEVVDIWADLGHNWRILESNFKAYPVCRWAHPPIVAALELMQENKVNVSDIQEIKVTTFYEATQLNTRRPADGDEAQYSLPLTLALSIIHGELLPEHILPSAYDQIEVWQLVDKVRFAQSDKYNTAFPGERYADVEFIMKDGRQFASQTAVAPGNYDAPLSDNEIIQKFDLYSAAVLSVEDRQKLVHILIDPAIAPTPVELMKIMGNHTVSLDIK